MNNENFQNKYNKDKRLTKNYIQSLNNIEDSREDKRFFKCNIKCSLCNANITDARNSHNALPLSENRCCEKCNSEKVTPARFSNLMRV